MLSLFKTIRILGHSIPDSSNSLRFFVKTIFTPVKPAWFKFRERNSSYAYNPEDDFVFPSIAKWVSNLEFEHRFLNKNNSDIQKITKILKRRFSSVGSVLEALNISRVKVSDDMVEPLLDRFSNDYISVLGFFNWAKAQPDYVHSPYSYNKMIFILSKRKEFNLMWKLFEEMHNTRRVSLNTVRSIMYGLSSAKKWSDAIELFRRIEQYGIRKNLRLMNILMESLASTKGIDHAENVFLEFRSLITPNIDTFNILIQSWCKVGRLDLAQKTMECIKQFRYTPTVDSYNPFVEFYCKRFDFDKVNSILYRMRRKGCLPSVITYTIVVEAFRREKNIDECIRIFEKMKQEGCKPDASFYNTMIVIVSENGRLDDAQRLYIDMKNLGFSPDVSTYNTMISIACLHSRDECGMKLLREMDEICCKPNLKTYKPLVKMCCRMRRMRLLWVLLRHMMKNNVSIEHRTYVIMVSELCESGMLEHACMFFEEAVSKGFGFSGRICHALMDGLWKMNMKNAIQRVRTLMIQNGMCRFSEQRFESDLAIWSGEHKRE